VPINLSGRPPQVPERSDQLRRVAAGANQIDYNDTSSRELTYRTLVESAAPGDTWRGFRR